MIELFQAEWCPSSHRVRERLTELGIDYVNRQAPPAREDRRALRRAVGTDSIPVLRFEDCRAIVGEENILRYLGAHFVEPLEAKQHRKRAAEVIAAA